ncbi:nucleotidyl transferase AbiEii/AbiGii toxin family protein [Candidatus Shapirobacteria bacterium]|nr:nucleotidyl transferase AbiEii/AbiGii toxin family protein [Candidatus Shapirobacteria bacterium]
MLTTNQLKDFSKILKINDSVVAREYIQTLFLKELYEEKYSQNIFFKGGTAIRLIFGGSRFSEDLDFTVNENIEDFNNFINKFFRKVNKLHGFTFKKRITITGLKYLLTANSDNANHSVFISLDFSFREKVLKPDQSIIITPYPVIFTSFVRHLSAEEITAEKVRAIMTRNKGRDIYDLWFLLSKNISLKKDLIEEKLKYYQIKSFDQKALMDRIRVFNRDKFVLDLRPFVPINERAKLPDFFDFTLAFIKTKLHS